MERLKIHLCVFSARGTAVRCVNTENIIHAKYSQQPQNMLQIDVYTRLKKVMAQSTDGVIIEAESDLFWLALMPKFPAWQDVRTHIKKRSMFLIYDFGFLSCARSKNATSSTFTAVCCSGHVIPTGAWVSLRFTCKLVVWSTDSAKSDTDTWSGPRPAPSPARPWTPRCSTSTTLKEIEREFNVVQETKWVKSTIILHEY